MRRCGDPAQDRYDAVVIGAGIGGLTAAAMLAKNGLETLVVEAGPSVGGCIRAFERGGYQWDPAVHLMLDPPHWRRLLSYFEVEDLVRFVDLPFVYRLVCADVEVEPPFGRDPFIDAHVAALPEAQDEIRAFLELAADTHELLHTMIFRQGGMAALQELMDKHPRVMRYRSATTADVLDDVVTHPRARALLGFATVYLGLPPSRASFSAFAQMMFSHAVDGGGYVVGGAHRLAEAMAAGFARFGGELVTDTAVERLLIDDDRVRGVRLDSGRVVEAAWVVSNADPFRTLGSMLNGAELPGGYRRKLRRLTPSNSVFSMFATTPLDLDAAPNATHLTLYTEATDAEAAFRESFEGRPGYACLVTPTAVPGAVESPNGNHQLITTTAAPYDLGRPWAAAEPAYRESALVLLDSMLPGVRDRISFCQTSTPEAVERHARIHRGAQYAWGLGPDGVGSRALDHATPFENLFLAGAWTAPGAGLLRAAISGRIAAMHVLGRQGVAADMPT